MAEHENETPDGPKQVLPGVLTDGQRVTFRSAGFWMAIIGWVEVFFGALAGLMWLLAALGAETALALEVAPSGRSFAAVQAIGSVIIGSLTLIAPGRSVVWVAIRRLASRQ
jgi:hypothetical protein